LWFDELFISGTVETGTLNSDLILTDYWIEEDYKDISSIDAYVDGKTLYLTVTDAYPGPFYWVTFDIYNNGTVPLHVCGFNVAGDWGPGVNLYYCPPYDIQIHSGESTTGLCVAIDLTNAAAQGATNTFTFEYVNVQYNEACPTVDIPFGP
jgi:hypothetical protein